ncbi:MAG TPA: hypothetical protein VN688_14395 [Gemmataceae bacterium]|nr:hypothetical protein [Gemmataceae bacterium]
MSTEPTIEQRLAALEAAVKEIQNRLGPPPPAPNWLDKVIGSMKDEPAFLEMLEYGRAYRQADYPPEDADS